MRRILCTSVLTFGIAAAAPGAATDSTLEIAPGEFSGAQGGLTNWSCPEWFRDAKFGIWSHWGPQAVPMMGDWYAKHMYVQGHRQYEHHLATYGHPSTNGWKDIVPLWKAEKWDPERLMQLYKKAGARYFVSMGSHHDNFFLWDSKIHRWNSVNMGPKRDVVGEWRAAARKNGLKFGVSEHLGASFTWFQTSHGSDRTGPLAGEPYDGVDPQFSDLYHIKLSPQDTKWYTENAALQRRWFDCIKELVDNYQPDLLYTDGGVPFGDVGRSLVAHLYNSNAGRHSGRTEAVYTCKNIGSGEFSRGVVQDMERGVLPAINPSPWQTDTSIGDWFYNRNWKFRPLKWTVQMLVDIVSKNGNLLLNVVQRPDGSLDPEVEAMLGEMANWISVHGEGIYDTRPWQVYGEGPVSAKGGHFKEDFAYTFRDIRFTTKGATLYAFAMGWPEDRRLVIRSLASTADPAVNQIQGVRLLGYAGQVQFNRTPEGLVVTLPDTTPISRDAVALRISGTGLKAVALPESVSTVEPDSQGHLTLLAGTAELEGDRIQLETRTGESNIGFWDDPKDEAVWHVKLSKPGTYRVKVSVATAHEGAKIALEAGDRRLVVKVPQSQGWDSFSLVDAGAIELPAGVLAIKAVAADPAAWKAVNLRSIELSPR